MEKDGSNKKYSPIIYQYLKRFQEDPSSKVFAPLSEAYRKSGLVEEAIKIAKEGLEFHPNFVSGRVALARALFDLDRYQEVVNELSNVIESAPDNLAAHKLIAESNLMLGDIEGALSSYRILLFYQPNDMEVAQIVTELETSQKRGEQIKWKESDRSDQFEVQSVNHIDFHGTEESRKTFDGYSRAKNWKSQIELLQDLLVRVERYRWRNAQ